MNYAKKMTGNEIVEISIVSAGPGATYKSKMTARMPAALWAGPSFDPIQC
jgi:hypothetical protein